MALVAIPFGLAIGVAVGLLGGGGSVLAVPVLVYVVGLGVHDATTASLVVVTSGALAGGLGHAREGRVCWRHAAVFTAAALPGVVVGTAVGNAVGGGTLLAAFAVVMLLAAGATWRRAGAHRAGDHAGGRATCPPLRLARGVGAGLLVGGGFLIVPALAVVLAFSMDLAVGTSLAIITATSLMGVAAHLLAGGALNLAVTGVMTGSCVAGALGGVVLAPRVPRRRLGHAVAGLLTAVATYLLLSAVLLGGPPGSS